MRFARVLFLIIVTLGMIALSACALRRFAPTVSHPASIAGHVSGGTRETMALTQGGQGYCDDGSEATFGQNGDQCADGTYPVFPPVQSTTPQCWDNCFYAPCGFYCNGSGAPPPPEQYPRPTPLPGKTSYSNCIYYAAEHLKGQSTLGANGNGAQAANECVGVLQVALTKAHLSQVGNGTNLVSVFASNLPDEGYISVSQANAVPGDLVILSDADGGTHAGMCETNGCTDMLSNSSSADSFSWEDTPQHEDKEAAYQDDHLPGGPITYFHHTGMDGSCPYSSG